MSSTLEAYLSKRSVTPGEKVLIHASGNAVRHELCVVRTGDKRPMGNRISLQIDTHPSATDAYRIGAGWPPCHEFRVPRYWPSAVYRLGLTGFDEDGREVSDCELYLVVRSDTPGTQSKILLQIATNTSWAYNNWGGHSTYAYNSDNRCQKPVVSRLRPMASEQFPRWELPFIEWCHAEGIGLELATNHDLHCWPSGFDHYHLILSVGHDEYWSGPMRDHLEQFIADGGNAAFFSGNSVCWQVRFEDDGNTMVAYKEFYPNDPHFQDGRMSTVSTLWSHPLLKRPENQLTGVGFPAGGFHQSHGMYMDGPGAYRVQRPDHWVFAGTDLQYNDEFGGADTIVGYETDGCDFVLKEGLPVPTGADGTPTNFEILAQCPAQWAGMDADAYIEAGKRDSGMANMGVYERGGTVFTAATTDWADGLKSDRVVQQITRNVIARLRQRKQP